MQDSLDKQIKIKQFFKTLYAAAIVPGNNLKDNQYIRVFQNNKTNSIEQDKIFNKIEFFNNIDDLVSYSSKSYGLNTFFTLATTKNNESGQEENLHTRYFMAWDFDKKDLGEKFSYKDIIEKFKSIGLWYHVLVDSGHGYHVYTCIEPTQDIKKVLEVQKVICNRLGADINAIKTTQVLRIPYTYNIKDKVKQVNIISMFDKDTIKRYNIDKLYSRYCCNAKDNTEDRVTQYTINNTRLQPCIMDILEHGSNEGSRNNDLKKIVVSLRLRNKSLNDILHICTEWNNKNNPKMSDIELNYQVNNMYDNLHSADHECRECKYKDECFNKVISDFDYIKDEKVITISESHAKYLKDNNRKGVKNMESNDLLVYCILKNHNDGLTKVELVKELTYTKKKVTQNVALSNKTLINALKSLEYNQFIEVEKVEHGKKLYKIKEINSKIELTYNISYSATYECVKGNISTNELRLYNYMRYLHHKQQREDIKALKGNLFQLNQIDLAKELEVTQGRISQMINNLIDEKLLGIWYRQLSKNNGFEFNIYRLNY